MISYDEALALIAAHTAPVAAERVETRVALGRITAMPVDAQLDVPAFDNAAMDGYSLRASETDLATSDSPTLLRIAGSLPAGSPAFAADGGTALEIMTGAPLPAGHDTVLPLEQSVLTRRGQPDSDAAEMPEQALCLTEPVAPARNVRLAGEDFRCGDIVIRAGTSLAPQHLMGLAASGVDTLSVRRTVRASLITTGGELVGPGTKPGIAQIRDANEPYLRALLDKPGIELAGARHAPDSLESLAGALRDAAAHCSLVITTGGVSASRYDLVPHAVRAIGGDVLFHKVAIRPGKPLLFARLPGGTLLFGLPGNPVAVAVGMRFFVMPALRALFGMLPERAMHARSIDPIRGRGTLLFFAKAHADTDASGVLGVRLLPGQESFRISPLLGANCWAIVPGGAATIGAGESVAIAPLYDPGLL